MTWWTLTYLDNNRSLHHLIVLAATNHPAHLMMAWSRYKPARQPVYRNVRGKRVFCGWKYIWDTPNLLEQQQPLDTFEHTFDTISLALGDHVWYFLYSTTKLYERYCQSPLIHVWPPQPYAWTTQAYVGTQLKGVYYTHSFTGPDGVHPMWSSHNTGLHSLKIWQLAPGPLGLNYRMYAIAGDPGDRILYRRSPPISDAWLPILTNAEAIALTGSTDGNLTWVETTIWHPAHLYVLFNSTLGDNGIWCLRSEDYGATWQAFPIFLGTINRTAGNISIGLLQGTSPYDPGHTIYAALCTHIGSMTTIWLSTNHGETWTVKDGQGLGIVTPRCLVDPTDQSIVYVGCIVNIANLRELWRSTDHGANLVEVDGIHHLGPRISPTVANMLINSTDQTWAFVLAAEHIWETLDYSDTWIDHGQIQRPAHRLAIAWPNPTNHYLARNSSGAAGPPFWHCHVIFASEDFGATMYGKAGAYACDPTGHGDSIPYNCGGVCLQGMQLFPPF